MSKLFLYIRSKVTGKFGRIGLSRKMEDIVASFADLISGSGAAGTPLVVVKDLLG
ncbi:MAG: hypothetical protein GX638_12175 [Crenarchaeota archaeon]|nr:hypothetical protein [Thermoproteota archaeon]